MTIVKVAFYILFLFELTYSQTTTLRSFNNQYDYVIITVNEFMNDCELLKKQKETVRNFKVLLTTKTAILSEFNDNQSDQENIQEFISFARTYWTNAKPKYFLIAGSVDKIPNFGFESIPNYEYSDTSYSDYDYGINIYSDQIDKIDAIIGRIAVRNAEELKNYFDKIIEYESISSIQPWMNRSLFLAGKGDDFNGTSSFYENWALNLSKFLPSYIDPTFIFENENSEYSGSTETIIKNINELGFASINFSGNGSHYEFSENGFFSYQDVGLLTNGKSPFFSTMVFPQRFSNATESSILDKLLFSRSGSIGGFAPVGHTYSRVLQEFVSSVYSRHYQYLEIGEIFLESVNNMSDREKRKLNIFGDPSLVLNYSTIANFQDDQNKNLVPGKFTLHQNYPNPFNPSTNIGFTLPGSGVVQLKVFDVLGREVAQIINDTYPAGEYEVTFESMNLVSGIYFYSLKHGDVTLTKKMLLMK